MGDEQGVRRIPVWMPHLQKRLLSEKPVAPMICPITCTSAMALGKEKFNHNPVTAGKTEAYHIKNSTVILS